MLRIAAAIFCVLLGAATGWAQPVAGAEVRANIAYGPDPMQQLDLCLPAGTPTEARPAVVMVHGGYWIMGDKGAYGYLCKVAAEQGIVAASIGYRLANGSAQNRWPAQLVDAQLAVRWLRFHAKEFAIDPERICALGDSAGGQLVVFLAALDRVAPGDYARELPGVAPNVACAVDNFGPVDLSADSYWPPDPQLFGNQDRTQVKDQERAASPLFAVGPATAPIMIAHGRNDQAVNVGQSLALQDALRRAHVPVRLLLLNCGHEFAGLSPAELTAVYRQEFDFIKAVRPAGGKAM